MDIMKAENDKLTKQIWDSNDVKVAMAETSSDCLIKEPSMILCTTPTPEQIKAMQALVASHASAGSFGAIVGFVSR